uniref:Uncharacterized protein n=1 Tax=Ditylenchus dipsaci TaxID=166011 RepID=A0A915EST7_9BILA
MDVLSESWDDSTILRRDNLLAELVLRLDRLVIRLLDESGPEPSSTSNCSRILALDMKRVASRMQLSPREHRTEISLQKHEQKKSTAATSNQPQTEEVFQLGDTSTTDEPEEDSDVDMESLLYGFSGTDLAKTQLLLTIGEPRKKRLDLRNWAKKTDKGSTLLQLFYKRLAPKLDVFHELNIRLAPISAMYDEDALDGLFDVFGVNNTQNNINQSNDCLEN